MSSSNLKLSEIIAQHNLKILLKQPEHSDHQLQTEAIHEEFNTFQQLDITFQGWVRGVVQGEVCESLTSIEKKVDIH